MSDNSTVADPYYVSVHEVTRHATSVFAVLSFCLGIPGNLLVILVHAKTKEKLVIDWMIFYLAVCDVLSLLILPMFIFMLEGYWKEFKLPNVLCKLHMYNSNSASMSAYVFCACTALERFAKVVLSRDMFSVRQARYIGVLVFLFCYCVGFLSFLTMNNNANGHCMVDGSFKVLSQIAYGSVMVVAVVSSLVMTFCYSGIGIYLSRKMKELATSGMSINFGRRSKSTIQMTKMLAIVTIVFLLSANIPYISTFILMVGEKPTTEPGLSFIFVLSVTFMINNFFNPFLYYSMNSSFRQRTRDIVTMCCTKYKVSQKGDNSGSCCQTRSTDAVEQNQKI